MTPRTLTATVLAVLLLPAALLRAHDATKVQDKELEGDWEAASFIHEGKDEPQAPGKILLMIHGDALTLKVGDDVRKATITVDATTSPRAIDLAYESGPDKGKTIRGVYEVKGDELRICHGDAAKDRPTEIASREGSGYSVGVWKRLRK